MSENGLDFRAIRWALQAAARELLPGRGSLSACCRTLLPDASGVEVWKHDETGRAHYKNLMVCGGVWICAPCSSKISERRRVELQHALNSKDRFAFSMVTYTLSHHKGDRLIDLAGDLQASYHRLTAGRAYQDFSGDYKVRGSVKSLEVTYSDRNGFHPHLHVLTVAPRGVELDVTWLRDRWQHVIADFDRTADYSIGCHVRPADWSAAEYVEKFGHERIKSYWGASGELTKGAAKLARDEKGSSMFQALYNSIVAPTGQARAHWGGVFVEYAAAFKGRHQLQWSRGLRAALGLGTEKTDKELAESDEMPSSLLATLSLRQWRIILSNDARGDVLQAAERGIDALNEFLTAIGAGYTAADEEPRRRAVLRLAKRAAGQ